MGVGGAIWVGRYTVRRVRVVGVVWVGVAAASVEWRVARRSRGGRSASSGGRFARGVRAWWECVRGRACVCGCGCVVGCYSPGGMWVVVSFKDQRVATRDRCLGRVVWRPRVDFGAAGSRAFDRGVSWQPRLCAVGFMVWVGSGVAR